MDTIQDNNTGQRAMAAYNAPTPTVISMATANDVDVINEIMRLRHTIKTSQKLEKQLLANLLDRHTDGQAVNVILKTRRRVLAWFSWVKQSVTWQEEQVIPAGWKLGKKAHHRFNPRDPKASVKDERIAQEIERIEDTLKA